METRPTKAQIKMPEPDEYVIRIVSALLDTYSHGRAAAMPITDLQNNLRAGGIPVNRTRLIATLDRMQLSDGIVVRSADGVYIMATQEECDGVVAALLEDSRVHADRARLLGDAFESYRKHGIDGFDRRLASTIGLTALRYLQMMPIATYLHEHAVGRANAVRGRELMEACGSLAKGETISDAGVFGWASYRTLWRAGLPVVQFHGSYWLIDSQDDLNEFVAPMKARAADIELRARRIKSTFAAFKAKQAGIAAPPQTKVKLGQPGRSANTEGARATKEANDQLDRMSVTAIEQMMQEV